MICCLILVYIVLKYLQLCLLTFFKATVYLYGRVGYIKDKIGYIKDKRIKNFQFIGPKTMLGNQRFKNVFPSNSTCLSFDWWLSGLQESTEGLGPSQRFPYYLAMALQAKYFNSNGFRRIVWFWICLGNYIFQKEHLSIEPRFLCSSLDYWFNVETIRAKNLLFLTCTDQSNLRRKFK